LIELPCLHQGDDAVEMDRTANHLVHRRRWLHCRHPQQPRGAVVTPAASMCGPACPGYAADTAYPITGLAPIHTRRLALPDSAAQHSFNGSLLRWRDRWLCAYRLGPRCVMSVLDEHFGVVDTRLIESAPGRGILHSRCALRQEDPRLFIHDGRLHMAFVGVDAREGDAGIDGIGAHVMYCELDQDTFRPLQTYYPHYPGRSIWEKNWGFFSHGGQLYAVYNIKPHVILRIDGDEARVAYTTETPHAWTGGHLRGGAPPVHMGDCYYHWFHGRMGVGLDAIYSTGVYTFASEPPFAVQRMTRAPIQWARPDSRMRETASVVFVAGAHYDPDSDRWLTSQGIHDDHVTVSEWDAQSVYDRLETPRMTLPPVWTIYCEELPDRKRGIKEEMRKAGINSLPWRSYHGQSWGLQTSKVYTEGECPITPGHAGLILGHYSLWQHLNASGGDGAIICEDDAILCDDFAAKAAAVLAGKPPDAQLIFLGHIGIPAGVPRTQVGPGLVRCDHVFGTHCYWVSKSALPVLLNQMAELRSHVDIQLIENVLRPGALKWYSADPSLAGQHSAEGTWPGSLGGGTGWSGLTEDIRVELRRAAAQLEGWCPDHKARQMAQLILTHKPRVVVEIGVFGGKSCIPMALACKKNGAGLVYAIDPWENDAALENYPPNDPNANWWSQQNLDKVYKQFSEYLHTHDLLPWVRIVRARSEDVCGMFGPRLPIDVLHIDGNHATETATRDVRNYLPRVRKGGWVWMDDVNWDTVKPACALVDCSCTLVLDCSHIGSAWRLYRKDT